MQKQFMYHSSKDWEASNNLIFLTRLSGGLFLILGITHFIPLGWEAETVDIFIGITLIVIGIFQMIFPLKMIRPTGLRSEFVIINNEIIKWKLGRFQQVNEIRIDEIESLSVFIGEVHVKSKSGDTLKLKSHKILNDIKQKQFFEIIQNQIQGRIKANIA